MNRVILPGRLTGEPEMRLVARGKLGELVAQYLKKGTHVVVAGRITSGSYQKDDQTVYTLDVTAVSIKFAESKATEQERRQQSPPMPEEPPAGSDFYGGLDDECPF